MTQIDDKTTFSLSVKTNLINEILTKRYFQKIPISDEDYLYTIFVYGLLHAKNDNPEFKVFTKMLIESGKVTKLD